MTIVNRKTDTALAQDLRVVEERAVRKIFKDKSVAPIGSQILATMLGYLVDCGLSDEEIGTVVRRIVLTVRETLANPEALKAVEHLKTFYAGSNE